MDKYKELLKEFISLKSISTDSSYQEQINEAADWLKKQFESHGFKVEVVEGYGNPVVVAYYEVSPENETCLVYGHYDVQPADKSDGWESEPFELTERDGRLYARGAIDNKGQVLVHMVNLFELIESGRLVYNVKFMIEGNEETGSPELERFFKEKVQLLKADFVMLSDGEIKEDYPTVAVGFRGGFNSTLTIKTSTTDLHSGLYGGAAPSSSSVLAQILNDLHDQDGKVTIDGFYDDVEEINDIIKERNASIPFSEENYKKVSGTKALKTEPGYDLFTQVGLRPAAIITGIQSGYTGEGYRNSVPAISKAKINFRLVKNQVPDQIAELFKKHIAKAVPEYADYELEITDPYEGTKLNPENKYTQKAEKILEEEFGKKVIFEYSGGGLPIVTLFDEIMKIPQVVVNLANEDCGMHAPNENFNIEILEKGFNFSRRFFSK